ncbi:MAG: hypothetical protein UIM26_06630, partial [Longicatena sp.]|nr:hypothetical protein [Longicatena sp.]
FLCKKRGIMLPSTLKICWRFKMKGFKAIYFVIFIGIILLFISFVWIFQNKFLYYPSYDDLAYINLTITNNDKLEEIYISADAEKYHGWGYKKSPDCPTIIYFGGNAQSSENFFFNMEKNDGWKSFGNCNVVMIDYPGYGLSTGKTEYKSILRMAEATYKYVNESDFYGKNEIIVMGFSLGTGVASYVTSSFDTDGLILVAPYNNARELYNNMCNIFHGPLNFLIRNPFPSDQFAKNVSVPTLIIASEDDEVVPYELSYRLKDYFVNYEFINVEGLYHNELLSDENVLNEIKLYVNNH